MPKQVLTDRSRRVLERVIRSSQAIAIPAILVLVLAVAGCSNETPVTPGDAASLDPVETGDSVAPADPGTSGEDGDSAQPGDTTNPGDTTPVEDHVENPADGPADDPIEPSVDIPSIEDLAAKILESKQIQLGWSVPLELGTVTDGARIQIRVASPGTEELAIWELEHQWEDLVVVADEALGLPGSTSTIEIDRPQKSGLTYFGLRILDLEGGTGPLSNATGLDLRAEPCVLYPDGSGAFEDMRAIVAHIRDTGENCEVELAPGTYTGQGNRDWDGVGLSVPIRVHAPEGATFDFQGEPGVLTANVRFVGVTFENSPSLRVTVQSNSNGGRFLAEGCAFENIVVEVADGAFGENPGEMTLIDCEVRRCEARDENGILQAGVLEARRSQILDCDGPIQRGIGLKLSDCTIEDCRNESGSLFHERFLNTFPNPASIERSQFLSNTGGLFYAEGLLPVTNCEFRGNVGPIVQASRLKMSDCEVVDNEGELFRIGDSTITGSLLYSNRSSRLIGPFEEGGRSDTAIRRSTIVYNTGTIMHMSEGFLEVSNVILAYNEGEELIKCDRHQLIFPIFFCTDIIGNSAGDWAGCLVDLELGEGNLNEPPRFCDPENGNFNLRADSPCRAAHNPDCKQIGAFGVGCGR